MQDSVYSFILHNDGLLPYVQYNISYMDPYHGTYPSALTTVQYNISYMDPYHGTQWMARHSECCYYNIDIAVLL